MSAKGGAIKIKHDFIKKDKNKEPEEVPVDNSDIEAVVNNLD